MKSTGCLLHVGQFNVDSPKGSTVHSVFWEIIWLSSTSVEIQLYLNHVRMNAKSNSHSFFSTMNVSFAGLATVHAFWIHEKSRRRLKIWKNFSQARTYNIIPIWFVIRCLVMISLQIPAIFQGWGNIWKRKNLILSILLWCVKCLYYVQGLAPDWVFCDSVILGL